MRFSFMFFAILADKDYLCAYKYISLMAKTPKYSEAMQELEQIVAKLQSPNCDVDDLCALTAKAIELLNFCKGKLTKVDEELQKTLENL